MKNISKTEELFFLLLEDSFQKTKRPKRKINIKPKNGLSVEMKPFTELIIFANICN